MANNSLSKISSSALIHQAVELVSSARLQVVRQTNSLMVFTYFHLGKLIIEFEQEGKVKATYGKETLKELSDKLTTQFGQGFSIDNLENMRSFYSAYKHKLSEVSISEPVARKFDKTKKPQTVSAKSTGIVKSEPLARKSFADVFPLSWTNYVILTRIKDKDERSFYEIESLHGNWAKRELQRQIDSSLFERLALSKNKRQVKQLAQKGQLIEKPEDTLKSTYILEFLGLEHKAAYTESDLETAIINKIEHFLLEMGKGFLFQGRQVRFSFDGEDFFVDLVLYNRLLQCFVLVDLKIGKLKHQDIGQMQMYVNYYDRFVKTKSEKPTIGIIICKDKSDAVIEITLPKNNKTIFAKEYKLYLPTKADLLKIIK